MTPYEFRQTRLQLGMSLHKMGAMLGYAGKHKDSYIHKIEIGKQRICEAQRRLMEAYNSGYRPADWPPPVKR